MAVRSIISVDVDSGAFNRFQAVWNKYQQQLKAQPAFWAAINQHVNATRQTFDEMVISMAAANVQAKLREKAQERADQLTRTTADKWKSMARDAREFARSVGDATLSLLKWTGVTGVVSGLIGAGGLWGLEHLASGAAASRRQALGLGTSIGGAAAFEANAARLVDPNSFLAGVAGAKFDISRRPGLVLAGLSQGEIAGDTTQTAVALLRKAKQLADTTNPALFEQALQARQMGQFFSTTDLERLRRTSPQELEQVIRQISQRTGQFNLPDDVAKRWQDFTTQMSNAGKAIETTLVKGLAGLADPISHLSEAATKLFGVLLEKGGPLERWVTQSGAALEKFANYVGTDEFDEKVKGFIDGVGSMAEAMARFTSFMASSGQAASTAGDVAKGAFRLSPMGFPAWFGGRVQDWLFRGGANNPGNLRPPGSGTGFQSFATPEAGVAAIGRQLRLYEDRDKLDTIAKILNKYAPPEENDTAAYVKDVAGRTGYGPSAHLNLQDPQVLARLVAAIINHEQSPGKYDRYKDAKVVVQVIAPAGVSTETSVNGLKN